jgi:hypothetical protein
MKAHTEADLIAFLGRSRRLVWANLARGLVCYLQRGRKRLGWL